MATLTSHMTQTVIDKIETEMLNSITSLPYPSTTEQFIEYSKELSAECTSDNSDFTVNYGAIDTTDLFCQGITALRLDEGSVYDTSFAIDAPSIQFYVNNEPAVTICTNTGEVTIRSDLTLSEAAQQFWQAVHQSFPGINATPELPTDTNDAYVRAMKGV